MVDGGTTIGKRFAFYRAEFPPKDPAAWQLFGLNSNEYTGANEKQVTWLRSELEKTRTSRCVLAFAHAFFYSSGFHGHGDSKQLERQLLPGEEMRALFQALYAEHASVFVAAHDHDFEQLGRANAAAQPGDQGKAAMAADGVRSFVVGTGGKRLYSFDFQKKWAFTEAYDLKNYGILKIDLYPDAYAWEFIPITDNSASKIVIKQVSSDKCNRA